MEATGVSLNFNVFLELIILTKLPRISVDNKSNLLQFLRIDLYHTTAILSPSGRTKSFVFARPASYWMRGETGKIFSLFQRCVIKFYSKRDIY